MDIDKSYLVAVQTNAVPPFEDFFRMALNNPAFIVHRSSLLNMQAVPQCKPGARAWLCCENMILATVDSPALADAHLLGHLGES